VHFIPLHLHPFYRKTYGYRPEDFPTATRLFEQIVSLPIYPKMTERDVQDVIEAVRRIVAQYRY
jgi:dTDP-4-amino-4,6-dideoxygalactose transaminase